MSMRLAGLAMPLQLPSATTGRLPLFCDTALAGRIELAEAQLIARACEAARRRAGTAGFVIPVAGGAASFAEPGSPFNKVAGLGFAGVPDVSCLDRDRAGLAARGAPVQVELALLADPAVGDPADREGLPARVVRERARPCPRR